MNSKRRLKLYLDTTIPSYVFALDSVERMEITRRFMRLRFSPEYELVISAVVLWELEATASPKRVLLMGEVEGLPVLPMTSAAESLAEEYLRRKILPAGSRDDARHVALATLHGCDALVSWNFGHLVNIRRAQAINALNQHLGLSQIDIVTPEEVLE